MTETKQQTPPQAIEEKPADAKKSRPLTPAEMKLQALFNSNEELQAKFLELLDFDHFFVELTGVQAKLLDALDWQKELAAKLLEAIETEHFLITVSCQKVIPPSPADLQHYYIQINYPPADVVNSLKHIAGIWTAKVNPTGDVTGAGGWV